MQADRPVFADTVRVMSSSIDLLESEPEPETLTYDGWVAALGLHDKLDILAGCGLDEGLELKQLAQMDASDLHDDILEDEDLGLDDETKDRFRAVVEVLSAAADTPEASSQDGFGALLARVGDGEA